MLIRDHLCSLRCCASVQYGVACLQNQTKHTRSPSDKDHNTKPCECTTPILANVEEKEEKYLAGSRTLYGMRDRR